MEELERVRAEKAQLIARVVELASRVTDLQVENASLVRSLDAVARMFSALDSEQAFHDAMRRAHAGAA
jgi:hypothetical protein